MRQQESAPDRVESGVTPSFADPRKIREIAAKSDPVQRNFEITQSYHELSEGMRKLLGDQAGPSWTTWASKHLGATIRGEDHPYIRFAAKAVEKVMFSLLPAPIAPTVLLSETSAAMAEANHNIFQRTAPKYSQFLATFADGKPDENKLKGFLKEHFKEDEGLLVSAFANYHQAISESDPQKKRELVLLANMQVVHDEQIHAHQEIRRGIPAFASWPMTRYTLALDFADESVRLGKPMHRAREVFQNPEVEEFFRRFSKDGNSAMHDYRELDCRMRFIVHLFGNYHGYSALFRPPFKPDQVAELAQGRPIQDRH